MTIKRTPGNWSVEPHDPTYLRILDFDGNLIAKVPRVVQDRRDGVANAEFMAVAPALFEALRDYVNSESGTVSAQLEAKRRARALVEHLARLC